MPGNKSVNLKLYDIHCHILPGVDDGSRSMEESLAMLGMEYDEGVRFILLTPHFRYDMFETGLETIKKRFQELQQQSKEKWPDLTLRLGCELHRSMDMVECLKDGRRLALNGTRYVLLEFSGRDPRSMIFERTKDLLDHGYRPIVAHVERYPVLREDTEHLEVLRDMGAFLQVNADTISGKDGFSSKWYARKLMKQGLIDFVGTDCHRSDSRTPALKKAYDQTVKTMGEEYAVQLFVVQPAKLFENA